MKSLINKSKLFWQGLSIFFVVLAIVCITLQCCIFNNVTSIIVNSVLIVVVSTAFSVICLIISKSVSYKVKVNKTIGNIIKSKFNLLTPKQKFKKILISIILFAAAGIGFIPLFIIGANYSHKINTSFVKTTATIEYVISEDNSYRLAYKYTDQNGNVCFSLDSASWGGVNFNAGNKVTIYYSKNNPEITIALSNVIMIFFGAGFFLIMGILIFFAQMELGIINSGIMGAVLGILFLGFPVCILTGIALAGGLSFIELLASGATAYAMLCFSVFGFLLLLFGTYQGIKDILATIKYHKSWQYKQEKAEINKVVQENIAKEKEELITKKTTKRKFKKKGSIKTIFSFDFFIINFVGLLFFAMGLWVFISFGLIPLSKDLSYNKVQATVINVTTYVNKKDGGLMATFTYEYYIDDTRYQKDSSYAQSADLAPSVGDTITIKVNPKDPTDCLDNGFTNYILIVVGLLFSGVGLSLIIWMIIALKK